MIICDLCVQLRASGECGLGLRLPKSMKCRDFEPGIEKFCASPSDFTGLAQITQMATYFGVRGQELKKINLVASKEVALRAKPAPVFTPDQNQ